MSVISGSMGAVMGSDATESAARAGASAQDRATEAQERVYQQQRSDFEPYRQIGLAALSSLGAAAMGGNYEMPDPRYEQLSSSEVDRLNNRTRYSAEAYFAPDANIKYALGQKWYRGPNGDIVSAANIPKVTSTFQPGQSPAAKYQLEQGNIALGRALGARGLAGGGGAALKLADLSKSVAASDWENQYNRLLDLVKVGTGASAATGGAAANLSNAYGVGAQNLGNLYNQAGQAKAGLYSGMGSASANTFGTGLRAYDYGKTQGWWGGGAASGIGGTAATDAAVYNAAADEGAAWALI